MSKRKRIVHWMAPAAWVALALLCACSNDDDLPQTVTTASDTDNIEILFTITLSDNTTSSSAKTRTTTLWPDTYADLAGLNPYYTRATDEEDSEEDWTNDTDREDGTAMENTITSTQILLFQETTSTDDDGNTSTTYTYAARVAELSCLSTTSDDGTTTYSYVGALLPNSDFDPTQGFTGRIVILANCSISDPTSLTSLTDDALAQALYSLSLTSGTTAVSTTDESTVETTSTSWDTNTLDISTNGIPMFGVATLTNITLAQGTRTDIGSIDLLRAMAKVRIELGDEMVADGYEIKQAFLNTYNTTGYALPKNYSDVTETCSLTQVTQSFNPCSTNASTTPLVFYTDTKSRTIDNTTYSAPYAYIYVPEYKAAESGETGTITVNIYRKGDDGYDHYNNETLKLQTYSNGKATGTGLDLVRNHIHTYTLSRTVSSEVEVTTTDDDWYYAASNVSWNIDDDDMVICFVAHDEYYHTDSISDFQKTYTLSNYTQATDTLTTVTYRDTCYSECTAHGSSNSGTYIGLYNLTAEGFKSKFYSGGQYNVRQNDYGDADAVWCTLCYPRWGDDYHDWVYGDSTGIANNKGTPTSSNAHYLLYVSPPSTDTRMTWKAYLTNTQDFKLVHNTADWKYTHHKTTHRNATQYYASTGVARDYPYMIAVECQTNYPWTTLQIGYMKQHHPTAYMLDADGNPTETTYGNYTWKSSATNSNLVDYCADDTSWVENWYESYDWTNILTQSCTLGGVECDTLLAVYTDLFILLVGTSATRALPINRSTDDNGQFVNWFAGGTHEHNVTIPAEDGGSDTTITLDQEEWLRIWRVNASTKTGDNDYANILTKINSVSDLNERWYNK